MTALNAEVELDGASFAEAARRFVQGKRPQQDAQAARQSFLQRLFAPDFARLAGQHLMLVFGSLAIALVVGVPMGVLAWRLPRIASLLLGAVGVLQTIPSLALLAFLIALVGGIGIVPAMLALFLYALLPIVLNTHAGLANVSPGLTDAGIALGLTPAQCLRLVQLPLALPTLFAGVKAAAVINVGTATMAAFIGAGGFGERIVAGLAINDSSAMLAGALPAAALALVVQAVFDVLQRHVVRGPRELP
jgi:osmoprotectant transport system permease protein